mmetsp:Transcript_67005/g.178167  ORF Transcript_67005/g.178167 Transcript_67005/m.178167 type:complete len:236 (+) Transcript_67005:352-1059(+)
MEFEPLPPALQPSIQRKPGEEVNDRHAEHAASGRVLAEARRRLEAVPALHVDPLAGRVDLEQKGVVDQGSVGGTLLGQKLQVACHRFLQCCPLRPHLSARSRRCRVHAQRCKRLNQILACCALRWEGLHVVVCGCTQRLEVCRGTRNCKPAQLSARWHHHPVAVIVHERQHGYVQGCAIERRLRPASIQGRRLTRRVCKIGMASQGAHEAVSELLVLLLSDALREKPAVSRDNKE